MFAIIVWSVSVLFLIMRLIVNCVFFLFIRISLIPFLIFLLLSLMYMKSVIYFPCSLKMVCFVSVYFVFTIIKRIFRLQMPFIILIFYWDWSSVIQGFNLILPSFWLKNLVGACLFKIRIKRLWRVLNFSWGSNIYYLVRLIILFYLDL